MAYPHALGDNQGAQVPAPVSARGYVMVDTGYLEARRGSRLERLSSDSEFCKRSTFEMIVIQQMAGDSTFTCELLKDRLSKRLTLNIDNIILGGIIH